MYKPDKNNIQDRLVELQGDSVFAQVIRRNARKDIDGVILMILSQAKDNRKLLADIIGEELLTEIENL